MNTKLLRQVIDIKKTLYRNQHYLNLEKLDLDKKFLFADEAVLIEKQRKSLELDNQQILIQTKLDRANLFSRRFSQRPEPNYIFCFVAHEKLPLMTLKETCDMVRFKFKCEGCGVTLVLDH